MLKDFYDIDTEPIVSLEAFYGKPKHIADKCLIIFSKEIHQSLLEHFECRKVGMISACNGDTHIYCMEYKGEKICFYLSWIGSALASGT